MTGLTESGSHAVEYKRAGAWETFIGINLIGSWEDHELQVPPSGYWGIRMYDRLVDARDSGRIDPFPKTHYWAGAGRLVYEHLRWSDGREREWGEGDTAGLTFAVRSVLDAPPWETDFDVAYPFRGDWADADYE